MIMSRQVAILLVAALVTPTGIAAAEDSATPSPSVAVDPPAGNQAPVAVDDPGNTVVAGGAVTIAVLDNDTDDGLGRPAGEVAHLEIATFARLDDRVTADPTTTRLTITSRPADMGRTFEITYTTSDGSLTSNPAKAVISVSPPPVPPAERRVSLTTASRLVALRAYTLHGSVSPRAPGPATVTVQRLVGTRWTAFRSHRVDARGRYAVRFSTNRPGRHVFRAVATWTNGRRAVSGRLTRSVVPLPDERVSGPLTRAAVPYSYRTGCPVTPSGLRRVTINRFTYSHVVARGTLIVRSSAVPALVRVFRASFASRFPVRSMRPSDAYYARGRRTPTESDIAAMRADNTSAFNCRPVTGNPYRVSQHSYGNAIDINTVRNPYVVGSRVYPSFARTYLDRSNVRTGMLLRQGAVATTMRRNGWPWGARWSKPDYQHFSATGG
jgi:hypothetical protein